MAKLKALVRNIPLGLGKIKTPLLPDQNTVHQYVQSTSPELRLCSSTLTTEAEGCSETLVCKYFMILIVTAQFNCSDIQESKSSKQGRNLFRETLLMFQSRRTDQRLNRLGDPKIVDHSQNTSRISTLEAFYIPRY